MNSVREKMILTLDSAILCICLRTAIRVTPNICPRWRIQLSVCRVSKEKIHNGRKSSTAPCLLALATTKFGNGVRASIFALGRVGHSNGQAYRLSPLPHHRPHKMSTPHHVGRSQSSGRTPLMTDSVHSPLPLSSRSFGAKPRA